MHTSRYSAPNQRTLIVVALAALACLLPTLAFPLSPDHAMFLFGGRTLIEGGVLYRDVIDIKPPLIYQMFAGMQMLFGSAEVALRLFDLLWQCATAASLYTLLARLASDRRIAAVAPVVYALAYTASGYASTMQCETYAALPILWLLYLYIVHPERWWAWCGMGLLFGAIVHLKYTLAVVIFPLALADLVVRRPGVGTALRRYALLGAGFVVCTLAVYLPTATGGAWNDYLDVLEFTRRYAALQSIDVPWLLSAGWSLLRYFGDKFSLVYTLAAVVGILLFMRRRSTLPPVERLLWFLLIAETAVLFGSIVVERKFLPYHFSRLFAVLIPLIAPGLVWAWERVQPLLSTGPAVRRALAATVCLVLLVATPLPRVARVGYAALLAVTDTARYDDFYTREEPESILIRRDQKQVAAYVRSSSRPGDRMLVVAVHAAPVYYFLHPERSTMLLSSPFYIAEWCAPQWIQAFEREVRHADWLIVQTNDLHPDITGIRATSMEFLSTHAVYGTLLRTRYKEERRIGRFVVYRAV